MNIYRIIYLEPRFHPGNNIIDLWSLIRRTTSSSPSYRMMSLDCRLLRFTSFCILSHCMNAFPTSRQNDLNHHRHNTWCKSIFSFLNWEPVLFFFSISLPNLSNFLFSVSVWTFSYEWGRQLHILGEDNVEVFLSLC